MAAYPPLGEEIAVAMPLPLGIAYLMVIILSTKISRET